jgi:hypothetical protein
MIRGPALRSELIPLLRALPWEQIDDHSYGRLQAMVERYGLAPDSVSRGSST